MKVIMMSEDKDLVFVAFQVVAPRFKGLYNGQKLLIMSFVIGFSGDHFLKEKSYKVLLVNFGLKKNEFSWVT